MRIENLSFYVLFMGSECVCRDDYSTTDTLFTFHGDRNFNIVCMHPKLISLFNVVEIF